MSEWIPAELIRLFQIETVITALRIIALCVVSFLFVKLIAFLVGRLIGRSMSPQSMMITRKVITYSGVVVIIMFVLAQLGLNLTALLGAAGIVGIAVGFAAQTSVSNIISGLFLISEKAFAVGDVIRVGQTTGVVLTIDLLSVKVRTFDNQYIRLPNETLIKTEVTNVTRFPIRRMDVQFTLVYGTDMTLVKEVLFSIVRANQLCLDEPEPIYIIKGFGRIGMDVLFGVWFAKQDFVAVKNSLNEQIHARFRDAGIEFAVAPYLTEPTTSR